MALCLVAACVPVIVGAVRKRKILKPVEYYAPSGASPIDVMLMYYGAYSNPRELFNPLILYWAQRGFITISEDCKRGLILTKLKDLEPPQERDGFNPETFKLEKELFDCIFRSRNTFYTLAALKLYRERVERFVRGVQAEAQTACMQPQYKIYKLIIKLMGLAMLAVVSLIVGIAADTSLYFCMLFPVFGFAFLAFALPLFDMNKAYKYFMIPFFSFFSGVPFCVVLTDVGNDCRIILCIAMAVSALIVFYLSWHGDIRTKEQLEYYARVCGFKNFLVLAEIQKLEALVGENQQYFYEILPYCYILKITDKLKAKFDRISTDGPAWYLGELRDTLMF